MALVKFAFDPTIVNRDVNFQIVGVFWFLFLLISNKFY